MPAKYVVPSDSIQSELIVEIERVFKEHFEVWNIHPIRSTTTYSFTNGEWSASVVLNWQRKPDFKAGQKLASFKYVRRNLPTGHEMYWYCSSGLPND